MKKHRGVTLMELMVVVSIIGILAAVGYPTYMSQALKGRRAAGKAMLHEVLQHQERFYTTNNTFTVAMADLGYGGAAPYLSEGGSHSITLAAGPSGNILTSVTVTATPVTGDAICGTLTLSSDNSRTSSVAGPDCW